MDKRFDRAELKQFIQLSGYTEKQFRREICYSNTDRQDQPVGTYQAHIDLNPAAFE